MGPQSHPTDAELDALARGAVAPARLQLLQDHVGTCGACRVALAGARADAPDETILELSMVSISGPSLAQTSHERFGPPAALLGEIVGDYIIEQLLGRGGMGLVYRARHRLIGKVVAIKVLRGELADEPRHDGSLLTEARSAALVEHESIVHIFDVGHLADGRQYLVMEYLAGEPLSAILKREGALPLPQVLDIVDRVLSALEAAHEAGIIHRDLKPSNLFVNRSRDGALSVKLLDFGLARQQRNDRGGTGTHGLAIGSPGYMSPEQILAKNVDQRTDLYALGVLFYELVTGVRPFHAKTVLELMRQHLEQPPPPPRTRKPDLPPAVEHLILELLEKRADRRPASAALVRSAVRWLRAPIAQAPAGPPPPLLVPRRRWWPLALTVATLLVSGGFAALWATRRPIEAPTTALPEAPVAERTAVAASPPPETPTVPEVAPQPQPPVDAGVVEAPVPRPSLARPTTPVRRVEPSLAERAEGLRRKVVARAPKGEEPDPMALMLLDRAQSAAGSAKTPSDRQKVEKMLKDIERNYLK